MYASGGLITIDGKEFHVVPVYLYCGCRVDMKLSVEYASRVGLKNWSYYMDRAKENHDHQH